MHNDHVDFFGTFENLDEEMVIVVDDSMLNFVEIVDSVVVVVVAFVDNVDQIDNFVCCLFETLFLPLVHDYCPWIS